MPHKELTLQFSPRLAAGKPTYVWQWGRVEQLCAIVAESTLGVPLHGVLKPVVNSDHEHTPFVPELCRALPIVTISAVRARHGNKFQVLYNLQSFFEIFRLTHDVDGRSLTENLRQVSIIEKSSSLFLGPSQVMIKIWEIFQHQSMPLARKMLDTFLELMADVFNSNTRLLISFIGAHPETFFPGRMANIDLATGNFERGWKLMECHYQYLIKRHCASLPHPFWNGESLAGRTVIFRRDPTLGEQILYVNALDELVDRGCRVVVECEERLVALFQRSFPRLEVIPRLNPPHPRALAPDISLQASYSAALRSLRDRLHKYPQHRGYLKPMPERVAYWRQETRRIAPMGLRVGVAWRSLRGSTVTQYTSVIQDWENLFRVPGVTFFRLQYDECTDELAYVREHFGCDIKDLAGIDLFNQIDELAALIASLDLVVLTSGVNMHVAGAVGTPCFEIMARHSFHFLGQGFDVFYPASRVFTRGLGRPIREAINKAAAALAELAGELKR